MARYEQEVEIAFGDARHSRVILCIGTVTISQWTGVGNNYVVTDVITDDSVDYVTRGLKLKFTPGAGDAVVIEEGIFA